MRPLAVIGLLLAALPLAACSGSDPGPVRLEVTIQDWTGWSEEQPEPETRTVTVSAADSFTVDTAVGDVEVTVADVSDDEIELATSEEMAPKTEDGSNLNDTTDEFVLERGDEVSFSTPTLDGGTSVTITEVT